MESTNKLPVVQAVTVGRIGSRLIRLRHGVTTYLWGIKLYELQPRKKDGVLLWRLASTWAERSGHKPSGVLLAEAKEWAEAHGIPFRNHIADKEPHGFSDLELLAILTR